MKFSVDIHAWVLMKNHVHLLCTPQQEGGKLNDAIGWSTVYVQYFNYQYQRSGMLWEGLSNWDVILSRDDIPD